MRIAKTLIFAWVMISPVASYALTADGITAEEVIKAHQQIINTYAASKKKALPEIIEYTYGMKLDIAKVIRRSPDLGACKVVPQLMTYEDSKGVLTTLKYQVLSGCRGKS